MYVKKEFETVFRYCSEWDLYRYYHSVNDNINITVQALECNMKEDLGYDESDTVFD